MGIGLDYAQWDEWNGQKEEELAKLSPLQRLEERTKDFIRNIICDPLAWVFIPLMSAGIAGIYLENKQQRFQQELSALYVQVQTIDLKPSESYNINGIKLTLEEITEQHATLSYTKEK